MHHINTISETYVAHVRISAVGTAVIGTTAASQLYRIIAPSISRKDRSSLWSLWNL